MKHFRLFAILLLLVCKWTTVAHGQTQEPAINIEFTDIPLSEAISRIEKSSKYTFFYDAKQTDLTLRVSLHAKQLPISAALRQMLAPTGLDFTISERQIALIPAARKAPAGSRTITGTVNDSHELPLAGVAVTLEGDNTRGTVSGNNGSFTITVPDADAVLSFTYLGYISKKVSVPVSQNSLEVFLAEDAVRMEDVVVVGYGTQKKVNLTGAITTVDDTQRKPFGAVRSPVLQDCGSGSDDLDLVGPSEQLGRPEHPRYHLDQRRFAARADRRRRRRPDETQPQRRGLDLGDQRMPRPPPSTAHARLTASYLRLPRRATIRQNPRVVASGRWGGISPPRP